MYNISASRYLDRVVSFQDPGYSIQCMYHTKLGSGNETVERDLHGHQTDIIPSREEYPQKPDTFPNKPITSIVSLYCTHTPIHLKRKNLSGGPFIPDLTVYEI